MYLGFMNLIHSLKLPFDDAFADIAEGWGTSVASTQVAEGSPGKILVLDLAGGWFWRQDQGCRSQGDLDPQHHVVIVCVPQGLARKGASGR